MAASCLPTWPLVLFGIIEPALLGWALTSIGNDPEGYYIRQHYDTSLQQIPFTPQARVLVLQTANVFMLLAGIAIICCWTPHADIVRLYLFVVAVADIGHVWSHYRSFGDEFFWDFAQWNDLIWGSVGVSVFLNINRWATLFGLFGPVYAQATSTKKNN